MNAMEEFSPKIEAYLLAAGGWVSAAELCSVFGLRRERALRACGEQAGLCTGFSISGDKGFRHVATATDAEFARFASRLRQHGIAELVRVRDLRARRARLLGKSPPRATREGQFLLEGVS